LMTFRSRVQLVDRVGRRGNGRVEPERRNGSADVVIDGLGHADDREPLFPELQRDAERAIAADGYQGVETVRPERVEQLLRAVALLPGAVRPRHAPFEGIPAIRRSEDGPAEVRDAADIVRAQRHQLGFAEQAPEAASDPYALPTAVHRAEHDGTDDGIQS